jgi:DNA polymerase-3 subunit epsilon
MREIVLDTETTGTDQKNDRIVEIGAVELRDGVKTGQTYHSFVNPSPRQVHPGALRVHGLSNTFLAGHPRFSQIVDEFLAFIGEDQLVIHNAPFDIGFLNAELARLGRGPLNNPVHDTLAHARKVKPGGRHNLDTLCRHFAIDVSHRVLHGALLDAEILVDVYIALQGGRQRALELSLSGSVTIERQHSAVGVQRRPNRPLTDNEFKAHEAFVSAAIGPHAIWHSYATTAA